MRKAILIISYSASYGWINIDATYQSIRAIDNNIIVIIVNNHNESLPENSMLHHDANVRYMINENNTYELGAIKKAVYDNTDITHFYIIHDSCEFKGTIPDFHHDEVIFWKTTIFDISPIIPIIKRWCENYFPAIKFDDPSYIMCQGLMGHFSRELLITLFEYGLRHITVTTKSQAVASEGILGILLTNLCPHIKFYYSNRLDDYICHRAPYDCIIKHAGGKIGRLEPSPSIVHITTDSCAHPDFPFEFTYRDNVYHSLNECLSANDDKNDVFLTYLSIHKEALRLLTYEYHIDQYNQDYIIDNDRNDVRNLLQSDKNRVYVLQYYGLIRR
jgi:hypothetical protein